MFGYTHVCCEWSFTCALHCHREVAQTSDADLRCRLDGQWLHRCLLIERMTYVVCLHIQNAEALELCYELCCSLETSQSFRYFYFFIKKNNNFEQIWASFTRLSNKNLDRMCIIAPQPQKSTPDIDKLKGNIAFVLFLSVFRASNCTLTHRWFIIIRYRRKFKQPIFFSVNRIINSYNRRNVVPIMTMSNLIMIIQ